MPIVNTVKTPEQVIVKPATYQLTLSLSQEHLDWLHSFCGQISGNFPVDPKDMSKPQITPLRQVTDAIWYDLKRHVKSDPKVNEFNYVKLIDAA